MKADRKKILPDLSGMRLRTPEHSRRVMANRIALPTSLVAHSPREPVDQNHWHLLVDHSNAVAYLAQGFARPLGLCEAAHLIGMWHDAGKASRTWQHYLLGRVNNPRGAFTIVPHAVVGAFAMYEAFRGELARAYAPALCIASHHSGLDDRVGFAKKIRHAMRDAATQNACAQAHVLLDPHAPIDSTRVEDSLLVDDESKKEGLALRIRMLHSCLIDADCLDTERHFDPSTASSRGRAKSPSELWSLFEANHAEFVRGVDLTRDLNARRASMYEDAVAAADGAQGFYSLTMPTGGGKTRAGMAFALRHARQHGLARVIVAIPFTSIIEQNAGVYRDILGERNVLEHHASTHTPLHRADETPHERAQRLAAQNWDAPVVVTTNVQFFESLFSSRNHRLRKLHNIANSLILLDEVQTLPPRLLWLTLFGLRRLVEEFGCTVVFSTATQPAFTLETLGEEWKGAGLEGVEEIVTRPDEHFAALKRVEYEVVPGSLSWDELASRVLETHQALVIVNTVANSLAALESVVVSADPDRVLYLSTRLCASHRREVLEEVQRRLVAGEACLLISTQVVEAGVDIDFPVVWRARAPMDAMIQAAGRCNREGRGVAPGRVYLFQPEDDALPGGAYRVGREQADFLLDEGVDLAHPDAATRYFRRLYARATSVRQQGDLIDDEFALNFESVSREYKLIDDDQVSVLVRRGCAPRDETDTIAAVLVEVSKFGLRARHLRALQSYMVSIRRHVFQGYMARGLIAQPVGSEELYEWTGGYDSLRGVTETQSVSDLIF